MVSTCASRSPNIAKKHQETDASSPVLGSGRKETGLLFQGSANKLASMIKKPPYSPLKWFPRKKMDSFLKRKIKDIQECGGMNLPLVEILGNANPPYSRIVREKIATQKAAINAVEAQKAAMVEASWCRILQAARIQSKDAESKLEKAKQLADEAIEEAKLMRVMMFDRPVCGRSLEAEFAVDMEVAAAVKKALFTLLEDKEEFKDSLRKLIPNLDSGLKTLISECHEYNNSDSFQETVNKIMDRFNELQEKEISSLAIIVVIYDLNAALRKIQMIHEAEKRKEEEEKTNVPTLDKLLVKHISKLERELKHDSKFEREIQEIENAQNQGQQLQEITNGNAVKSEFRQASFEEIFVKPICQMGREKKMRVEGKENMIPSKTTQKMEKMQGLDKILVKHQSKFES